MSGLLTIVGSVRWSTFGQILASRQGHISPMCDSELTGRLQHFLHLMELTAMFSNNSDYSSFAWHRARNWSSIRPKMDPTSMMQAIEAVPKPEIKKKDDKAKKSEDGPPCSKWNSCDVKGKCNYEVENPGKTCNRPHICSYCYTKFGHTKTNHKESFCKKKDDGESSAGGNQPTS